MHKIISKAKSKYCLPKQMHFFIETNMKSKKNVYKKSLSYSVIINVIVAFHGEQVSVIFV